MSSLRDQSDSWGSQTFHSIVHQTHSPSERERSNERRNKRERKEKKRGGDERKRETGGTLNVEGPVFCFDAGARRASRAGSLTKVSETSNENPFFLSDASPLSPSLSLSRSFFHSFFSLLSSNMSLLIARPYSAVSAIQRGGLRRRPGLITTSTPDNGPCRARDKTPRSNEKRLLHQPYKQACQ